MKKKALSLPMKKKALSLAVAAALAAPTVALADATLYGQAHVTMDWFNIKGDETAYRGWTLNRGESGKGNSRANRLGVKGSEDLSRGLKAIYQIEFGVPLANEGDSDIVNGERQHLKMRNTYVGLKGAFGTFLAGRHDTPFKISTSKLELFNDTMADYEGTLGFDDHRADNTILYVTPSIQGFQFAAAIIPGSSSTLSGDRNSDSKRLAEGYSLAATYANGPWYFSAAHEVLGKHFAGSLSADPSDFKKWRVGLGLRDWAGFHLSALYEHQESIEFRRLGFYTDQNNDADLWQAQIGYAFGNNMVKAMYGQKDHEINVNSKTTDVKSWAVGFDHNLSQRTKAYALYTNVDGAEFKESDWEGFSLGMIHSF